MKDMTNGNVAHCILMFALPVLLGNLFQQFYLMADTMIVGKLLGVRALAAMGSATVIAALIMGFCSGIAMGVSILVAQYFGAKDEEGMRHAIGGSYVICLISAVLLCILSLVLATPVLQILQTPTSIIDDANMYLWILLTGTIITMGYNLFASLLRSLGDAKSPLYFLIIASILNIVLDYIFITYAHLGIAGAAIATVISQLVSLCLCVLYCLKHYRFFFLHKNDFHFETELLWKQFTMGISMGLMNSIVSIGTVVLQSGVNALGENTIAAHTAARKVVEMFMQPLISIAIAITTFVSQNMGASKWDRILEGMKKSVRISMIWVIFVIVISFTCIEVLLGLLVTESKVIALAAFYTRVMSLFYGALAVLFIYRNALQGLGIGTIPIISSIIEMLVKIIATFTLIPWLNYFGVALAEPIAWCLMAIVLVFAFHRCFHKLVNYHS